MNENEGLVHVAGALDIESINRRIEEMRDLMKRVFREDVDYGYLPGMKAKRDREDQEFKDGKRPSKSAIKPMLLKPGVEKLGTRYGLFPFYLEQPAAVLPGDHREVKLICELRTIHGVAIAQGVGSCSTFESKYRYRWEDTGKRVPESYWETRDPEILGGKLYSPRKHYDDKAGKTIWTIFEKVDVADPADYWNTIYKMAAKRAKSDATFSATGAGDIFDSEDLEDPDLIPTGDKKADERPGAKANPPATPTKDAAPSAPTQDAPQGNAEESFKDKLFHALNGDTNELKRLTTFKGKDGKMVNGKSKWEWVSEAGAKAAYGRYKDEQEAGAPMFGGDQREPGQEG